MSILETLGLRKTKEKKMWQLARKISDMKDKGCPNSAMQEVLDVGCDELGVVEDDIKEMYQIVRAKCIHWNFICGGRNFKPSPDTLKVGEYCTSPMRSGRIGIYQKMKTEWVSGVDWNWHYIKFVGYEREDNVIWH